MILAMQYLVEDEQLVSTVYEAPRSRPRGVLQPAHLTQPQAIDSKGNKDPATSDVTDLRSRSIESWIYLRYQRFASAKVRHGMP
jgi:hypothetical protein